MLGIITFQEFSEQLSKLQGKDIEVSYQGALHVSPILINNFDYAIFPHQTTFFYDFADEKLMFHREKIKEISMIDDEDGLCLCVTFNDNGYIVIAEKEDKIYENN